MLSKPSLPHDVGILALAFLAGGAVMVLELAAPRLVAPHLGTSALTWTVVIATFLAGLALGNAWGGRLADRPRGLALAMPFAISAVAAAFVVPLNGLVATNLSGLGPAVRVLVAVPIVFLPVAIALGLAAPVLARVLLVSPERHGRSLGAVAAAGAVGSVVGTFLAGFSLVPALGTRSLFYATAAVLAACVVGALPWGRPRPRGERESLSTGRILRPRWIVLAALAGAVLLTVEIAAARSASDRLGSSVFTWTAVIGVVLGGVSIGAFVGGRLADRFHARTLLGWLLLAASVAVLPGIWAGPVMSVIKDASLPGWLAAWQPRVLLAVATAFLLPSVAIGTLSPVIARAALSDPARDGRIVGGLYAAGSLGAVGGALVAGFVLVPLYGIPVLLILVALVLAVASGTVLRRRPVPWLLAIVALGLLAWWPDDPLRSWGLALDLREDQPGNYVTDSRYQRIRVGPAEGRWVRLEQPLDVHDVLTDDRLAGQADYHEGRGRLYFYGRMSRAQRILLSRMAGNRADADAMRRLFDRTRHDVRILTLNRLIHGYVDLDDPTWMGYEYEHLYDGVMRRHWPEKGEVRCLFMGGGAYAFQRRLLAIAEDRIRLVTAEIDPGVTEAGYDALGLVDHPRHRIVHEDARTCVAGLSEGEGGLHFAFGDAFDDLAVPYHLTTQEFARELKARMAPTGIYMVNVVDIFDSGLFLGAFVSTLETVFANVHLASMEPRDDAWRDTFILVASDAPIDLAGLKDDRGRSLRYVVYDEADMDDLRARAGHRILTDDHAPVESLLAPVVLDREKP